jgi:hypothetical protein
MVRRVREEDDGMTDDTANDNSDLGSLSVQAMILTGAFCRASRSAPVPEREPSHPLAEAANAFAALPSEVHESFVSGLLTAREIALVGNRDAALQIGLFAEEYVAVWMTPSLASGESA